MIPNNRERAITYLAKTYDFANSQNDQELLEAFVDEAMKSKDFLLSLAPDQKVYIYGHAGFQNIPESDAIDKWRFRTPKGQKTRGGDMLFNNYRYAVETVRKVPVVYNARGLQLITQNDEVLGVWVEIDGKKQAVKACWLQAATNSTTTCCPTIRWVRSSIAWATPETQVTASEWLRLPVPTFGI